MSSLPGAGPPPELPKVLGNRQFGQLNLFAKEKANAAAAEEIKRAAAAKAAAEKERVVAEEEERAAAEEAAEEAERAAAEEEERAAAEEAAARDVAAKNLRSEIRVMLSKGVYSSDTRKPLFKLMDKLRSYGGQYFGALEPPGKPSLTFMGDVLHIVDDLDAILSIIENPMI